MVSAIVSALLTGLATAGFINLTTKPAEAGGTTIFSDGQPIVTVPQTSFTQEIPYLSLKATFERVSTSATSKPATPNVRIINAIDNNRLLNVSIIGDSTFNTEGEAILEINNGNILTIKKGALTDVEGIGLPIPDVGLALAQSSTVDFSIWNTDGNTINATVLILTGVKQGVSS